jgi:cellulase/cellobiase CelA1
MPPRFRRKPSRRKVSDSVLQCLRDIDAAGCVTAVVQFAVYNLPDRDCSAKASDGELHLSDAGEKIRVSDTNNY